MNWASVGIFLILVCGLGGCGKATNGPQIAPQTPSVQKATPTPTPTGPLQSSSPAEPTPTVKSTGKNISELLPQERQDLIIDLAERLERNPGIEAYVLPGDRLESDGSRLILIVSNTAELKVYGGETPNGAARLEFAVPGMKIFNESLLKNGFQKGYDDNVVYLLNCEFGIYGRDLIIGFANQIKNGRR
jgi:hypothetical protein